MEIVEGLRAEVVFPAIADEPQLEAAAADDHGAAPLARGRRRRSARDAVDVVDEHRLGALPLRAVGREEIAPADREHLGASAQASAHRREATLRDALGFALPRSIR